MRSPGIVPPAPDRIGRLFFAVLLAAVALPAWAQSQPLVVRGRTSTVRPVSPGVAYHEIAGIPGFGTVRVVAVDLRCARLEVLKAGGVAAGTAPFLSSLGATASAGRVVAGVNGDMFEVEARDAAPTGVYVHDGRVIAGNDGPLRTWWNLTMDSAGVPRIQRPGLTGTVTARGRTIPLTGWNRRPGAGVTMVDRRWGGRITVAARTVVVRLRGAGPWTVESVTTIRDTVRVTIPDRGALLLVGPSAPRATRAFAAALRAGDAVRASYALQPRGLREAVGGYPRLVVGGQVAGQEIQGARALNTTANPRTAVALARGGGRAFLVTVESPIQLTTFARLLADLGAWEALNLDGGPSTMMAVREGGRLVGKPDSGGGIGNVLAVVGGTCPAGSSRR